MSPVLSLLKTRNGLRLVNGCRRMEQLHGISVLPYDGGTYIQTPFEDITKEKFEEMLTHLTNVDLSKIIEIDDNTNLSGGSCVWAGGCDVK